MRRGEVMTCFGTSEHAPRILEKKSQSQALVGEREIFYNLFCILRAASE